MTGFIQPRIVAFPLRVWVLRELELIDEAACQVLAARMGVSRRLLMCWAREVDPTGRPRFTLPLETVDRALSNAGVLLWEVFPWEMPGFAGENEEILRVTAA